MSTLLSLESLDAYYGDFQALFGISFEMTEAETVALVGANGAGKSTFLKCLAGLLRTQGQSIMFRSKNIAGSPAFQIARSGIAMSPEGRRLFPSLSVEENLLLGANVGRTGQWDLAAVHELFPILKEKRDIPSTLLSGGQQQMVAIGRALMSNPELLLLDEVSLGLAPVIVRDIYAALPKIRGGGTAVLVVEQDISMAMKVSDRMYCFQEGHVNLTGNSATMTREMVSAAYFGREKEVQ
ncbi:MULTISPECIES: ABC transporter ATP-binding protein [unclassified Sulfitobacter]|uniref:ABC transporter ATP-binding protein n=1 Tax=unclassified Sulfitobacter TaxID=196795 RepID=UPI0004E3CFEB|nr:MULTISPECIES: ABC transporter ATP-binding protein [unclassified Sulfitobacter]PTA97699.1 ABC transporter ATP-binding protein [Sulfitobacter sp. CB-A]ULO22216.1 ABC transporter ATP-binding protein [Sulfitobacter sp. CB2047]